MNFQDFVQKAWAHLLLNGWEKVGHNGTWPMFRKGDRGVATPLPLPASILNELADDREFMPDVEAYLMERNWQRASKGAAVSQGSRLFFKPNEAGYMRLEDALIRQLRLDRLDRATVAPVKTPADMKELLDVAKLRAAQRHP